MLIGCALIMCIMRVDAMSPKGCKSEGENGCRQTIKNINDSTEKPHKVAVNVMLQLPPLLFILSDPWSWISIFFSCPLPLSKYLEGSTFQNFRPVISLSYTPLHTFPKASVSLEFNAMPNEWDIQLVLGRYTIRLILSLPSLLYIYKTINFLLLLLVGSTCLLYVGIYLIRGFDAPELPHFHYGKSRNHGSIL